MTVDPIEHFPRVLTALRTFSLLLVSDRAFPNVATLITGENLSGSWWSHPLAHTIFGVNEMLGDHRDVLITKLVDGKITFVHRKLWTQVHAVGMAREAWQMNGLSRAAKTLLKRVEKETNLETEGLGSIGGKKPGDVARELESRLLIHTEQVHTKSGAHAKRIETWDGWAKRVRFEDRGADQKAAKLLLEKRVGKLNKMFDADAKLPWQALHKK